MPDSYLSDKTLIMLVGPTAIGKSTIMNEVIKLDSRFSRVRSFTTRPPRENDEPGHYIYLSDEQLAEQSAKNAVITDIIYPTTGYHYGTVQESYLGEFCLLDTLAHSVEEYRSLAFKRTITVSVTADPSVWQARLDLRFQVRGEDYFKRLEEGRQSIEWSLAQDSNHYWLVSTESNLLDNAKTLIRLAEGLELPTKQPPEAKRLSQSLKHLLSYQ